LYLQSGERRRRRRITGKKGKSVPGGVGVGAIPGNNIFIHLLLLFCSSADHQVYIKTAGELAYISFTYTVTFCHFFPISPIFPH
jgi:hypothetical protein